MVSSSTLKKGRRPADGVEGRDGMAIAVVESSGVVMNGIGSEEGLRRVSERTDDLK